MELKEVMQLDNFVVVGNTIVEDKYAYRIKHELINAGYQVECVGKELDSINDVKKEIDVLDLCINPVVGIKLLKENKKKIKTVVIQPGAESNEIIDYLNENKIDYLEGCVLVGLRLYKKIPGGMYD